MKQLTLILIFILTVLPCFGQKERLWETLSIELLMDGLPNNVKEYYKNRFPLLYNGFSQKPYARYTSISDFYPDIEYAFSIEKIDSKNYVISNVFSENYWSVVYTGKTDSVKVNTGKAEIDSSLYMKTGELFELLSARPKKPFSFIEGDGVDYYFSTTNKSGEIITGMVWSPDYDSLLGRLVNVCDNLYSIGMGNNISQTEILKEIEILINDLKQ